MLPKEVGTHLGEENTNLYASWVVWPVAFKNVLEIRKMVFYMNTFIQNYYDERQDTFYGSLTTRKIWVG